jgi:hypothetical protein
MMLRFAYSWVLRFHPSLFRQRFGQEMLAIFDLQQGLWARNKLLADGILSLLRQWLLRPEFWAESHEQSVPSGVPLFYMVKRFTPRIVALIDGGLVSIVTFTMVCLMMQYTWQHPVVMPIVSYYRARPHPSARGLASQSRLLRPEQEQPVYVDGGRVFLVVQGPSDHAQTQH